MLSNRESIHLALRKALGEQKIVGDLNDLPDQVVKSAGRVLQILELFDVLRREALVSEVSELLDLPQSSTSNLLRSLACLGYLSYNRRTRAYFPTSKVAFLGSWINTPLASESPLLQLMRRLSQRTGQTIVLAVRDQTAAQYVHVVQATTPVRLYIVNGSRRSLIASSTGYCLLAELPEDEINRITSRIRYESKSAEPPVNINDLMAQIADVRREGYAMTLNLVTPGAGMIAMPLPKLPGTERFVIGVGGVSEILRVQKHRLIETMTDEIANYCAANTLADAAFKRILRTRLPRASMAES